MINRRAFLKLAGVAALMPWGCARWHAEPAGVLLNDVHSGLNPTTVRDVIPVRSSEDIQRVIERAMREERGVSVAGGRHAMGAQQFGTDTLHVDTRSFNRVLNFDPRSGLIEVEAGMQWPELIQASLTMQAGATEQWGIVQKQTGADRLSIGGSLSANIHGRGLRLKPFVGDIESFKLVSADGQVVTCSRSQNSDLFKLAIGGYGLFGVVSSVTLRLTQRQKLQRVVELVRIDDVMERFINGLQLDFSTGTVNLPSIRPPRTSSGAAFFLATSRSIPPCRFLLTSGKSPRDNGCACSIWPMWIRRQRSMCIPASI